MSWFQSIPDPVWAWGPAFFLLAGLYMLIRAALKSPSLVGFVKAQREQAVAMRDQAASMSHLVSCMEASQKRGTLDNQELMIMLKVLRGEIKDVRSAMEHMTERLDRLNGEVPHE